MSRKSQLEKIRKHLMKGRSITPIEALLLFGCFRLGARIWDLRHNENIPIITEKPGIASGKRHARYHIDKAWLDRRRREKNGQ